jgi:hypothetical protein
VKPRSLDRAHRRRQRYGQRQVVDGRLVHPDAPHGTPGSYQNWGCRCLDCTQASVASRARWRKDDPAWTRAGIERKQRRPSDASAPQQEPR